MFDFEPNPDFKPRKIAEKVVHQLAGVIWIDEKAHDVVRLQAYFVGDFQICRRDRGKSAERNQLRVRAGTT